MISDKEEKQLVGTLIRVLREFCYPELTQGMLDSLIGREHGYVNRIENGTRTNFAWRTYGLAVVTLIKRINYVDQVVDRLSRHPDIDNLIVALGIVLEKGEVSGAERANVEEVEKRLKPSNSVVNAIVDESIRKSLPGKLKEDYRHAYIDTRNQLEEQLIKVIAGLRESLSTIPEDSRLPEKDVMRFFPSTEDPNETSRHNASWCIFSEAWNGVLRDRALEYLYGHRIRFGSAAIHPSVEAAMLHLKLQGLDIEIDSDAKHGIEQVDKIENESIEYDFLVLADSNMFQRGLKKVFSYLYVMPVFGQSHHFIQHQQISGRARQLIIAKDSSAHHQQKLGIEVGDFEEVALVDINELREIICNLESNQTVLAWDPLTSTFGKKHDRITRQVMNYELTTSFYCHRRYWDVKNKAPSPYIGMFLEAFIAAWNFMKNNREETCFMLASDQGFLERYCSAI
jgi:hypothetical protein